MNDKYNKQLLQVFYLNIMERNQSKGYIQHFIKHFYIFSNY